ncbi:MAG: hypothetical protein WC763_06165 [Candidatus Paceibacterota bacterium]|jgi:hypothetical protein
MTQLLTVEALSEVFEKLAAEVRKAGDPFDNSTVRSADAIADVIAKMAVDVLDMFPTHDEPTCGVPNPYRPSRTPAIQIVGGGVSVEYGFHLCERCNTTYVDYPNYRCAGCKAHDNRDDD